MSKLKFNQEYFTEFYPDALPLFEKHNEEVNLFNEDLSINTEVYLKSEEMGSLKIYTIRNDGALVGYCAFFLFKHAHHSQTIHARQDVFYIDPELRKKGLGKEFLEYCNSQLDHSNVQFVHQCVPAVNDWSVLLEKMNYKKLETIYIKEL